MSKQRDEIKCTVCQQVVKQAGRGRPRETHTKCGEYQRFFTAAIERLDGIEFADKAAVKAIRGDMWSAINRLNTAKIAS